MTSALILPSRSENRLLQRLDVQSGLDTISKSSNASGMVVGSGFACRLRERNTDRLSRDSASAPVLTDPLMWDATSSNSNFAVIKARHLARCMASLFREEPWLMMATTAELPHQAWTVLPCHALSLLRKVRPALTTLHACDSMPISERSSRTFFRASSLALFSLAASLGEGVSP